MSSESARLIDCWTISCRQRSGKCPDKCAVRILSYTGGGGHKQWFWETHLIFLRNRLAAIALYCVGHVKEVQFPSCASCEPKLISGISPCSSLWAKVSALTVIWAFAKAGIIAEQPPDNETDPRNDEREPGTVDPEIAQLYNSDTGDENFDRFVGEDWLKK